MYVILLFLNVNIVRCSNYALHRIYEDKKKVVGCNEVGNANYNANPPENNHGKIRSTQYVNDIHTEEHYVRCN